MSNIALSLRKHRYAGLASTVAAAAFFCLTGTPAQALVLDFGSNAAAPPSICGTNLDGSGAVKACVSRDPISQSYGDIGGVLDLSYSSPRLTTPTSLKWWGPDYNNLYGVLFAEGNDSNSLARIEMKALQPGASVTLSSFDLGAWSRTTRNTNVNVYAIGGGTPLFTFTGDVGDGFVSATNIRTNITVAGGLWLEWADSAYNVGIDNIQYSVSAVPEPTSAWLMLAGAAALGVMRRRRR
jgi:PEP-CTERM motif